MALAIQQGEGLRPDLRRSRRVRAALAITLIALLAVQSLTAFASPKLVRASARPQTPVYQLQAPARSEPHTPSRYVPGAQKGKDPRSC